MPNRCYSNFSKSRNSIEIYYWSKMAPDEKLAGGDIRAKYVIPEMMRVSGEEKYLILPETMLSKKILSSHQSFSKLLMSVMIPLKVTKLVNKSKKQIKFFYCSTCYSWDTLPALIIKFIFHTKVICISHDTPKQLSGYSFYRTNESFSMVKSFFFAIIGRIQTFLLRYIDIPVGISIFAMDFFADSRVRGRAILSSNTVPQILNESDRNLRNYDIVLLGRIIPRKNVNKLIKSLKNRQYARKINLLVITNSPKQSVENEIIKDLDEKILNLTVKYDASEEEKFELLKLSKVYISLSKDENFSIAAMEAASMGVALILSDHNFFRDIYGKSAIYVDEDDSQDIWNNIINLLNNPNMLSEYSKKSIEIAMKYLVENVAKGDYNLIQNKIGGEKKLD